MTGYPPADPDDTVEDSIRKAVEAAEAEEKTMFVTGEELIDAIEHGAWDEYLVQIRAAIDRRRGHPDYWDPEHEVYPR